MPRKAARDKDQPTIPAPSAPPTTSPEPEHSKLGASGMERWANCPGSLDFIDAMGEAGLLTEVDEADYRAEGIAMHEAAAHVLVNGLETWEIVGQEFHGVVIDTKMGEAIGMYVEHVLPLIAESYGGAQGPKLGEDYWVEARLRSDVHPLAYGTVDFGAKRMDIVPAKSWLRIRDLKGGEGIAVEAHENPQMMYYAVLLIDNHPEWDDDMNVELGIIQPRAFHPDGPVRLWPTTVGELREWRHSVMQPAMVRAEVDGTLLPGDWCRFCPARVVCPALQGLFKALCNLDPREVVNWSDASLDRSYALLPMAKHAQKAIEDEVFKRLYGGSKFESGKLVQKKANRVFKTDAADEATKRFGEEAFTKPALKSPPQIEELGPKGKAFVKEYAFSPNTGLTVAPRSDPRLEVPVESTLEKFSKALDAVTQGE